MPLSCLKTTVFPSLGIATALAQIPNPCHDCAVKKKGHLWLLGLSGSGKSTLGPLLAKHLGLLFVDTDQRITELAGCSIPEIFKAGGESHFRQFESRIVSEVSKLQPAVVSCGAGVVLDPVNRQIMSNHGIRIYLQASLPVLAERLSKANDRPLLSPGPLFPQLQAQWEIRRNGYEESELMISVDDDTPDQILGRILEKLSGF
jgi:shikimate kinase